MSDGYDPAFYAALMIGEEPVTFRELIVRPEWHAQAACRDSDLSFFPERGESTAPAKAVCAACPVRVECFEFVMSTGEPMHGIWAGTSERERRQMRRHSAA